MALFGNFDNYTKTGDNFFTKASNFFTYIPIPVVSTALVGFFGMVGTLWDSAGWLLRGKPSSALSALGAGAAATATNSAVSAVTIGGPLNPLWWINVGSGVTTGVTAGGHVRKLTETVEGAALGVVGVHPTVLQSHTVGIGSIGGGQTQAAPGRWVSSVAQSRGEDPNAAYARLNSNEPDHMAALQSASQSSGLGV